jgi:hypothetical protein
MKPKHYRKKGRPNKPAILRKDDIVKFRAGYRLNLGLHHYSKQRGYNRSRLIREALEYYFKVVIPTFKNKKDLVVRKNIIDYSKEPIVDYSFMFDDFREIPCEMTLEEFNDYEEEE